MLIELYEEQIHLLLCSHSVLFKTAAFRSVQHFFFQSHNNTNMLQQALLPEAAVFMS